jgi:hypothetical protein
VFWYFYTRNSTDFFWYSYCNFWDCYILWRHLKCTDGRWTLGANGTSSDYTFVGIGFTQTTNDPVLYLARGRVYEFVNNSGGSHPFQIRVSDGGAAYSDGVTNNSAASGVIRFEVPFNAPNTLYYQCTSHSGMGNTISVYPTTI